MQNKEFLLDISEEKFIHLLEVMPDASLILNQDGCIVFLNSQLENLFGYPKADILGRKIDVLIPEFYPNQLRFPFKTYHNQSVSAGKSLSGKHKNGNSFPLEISVSPFATNKGTLIIASIHDITERKAFEQALQEKNIELEKANLAKDKFLASMSHELRTPLNAIIGFTGTLLMKLPGPLNTEQERQLTTVKNSARHLLSLINDLLDLAKIESGKIPLLLESVTCQHIVRDVAETLFPLAEQKGLTCKLSLPDEPIIIQTDKRSLTQIILNFVNNAIKFTDGGEVEIRVQLQQQDQRSTVSVDVIDTGIGIRFEDKVKLFQAFQQLSLGERVAGGTGLGLHLCKKLAELIHGDIVVESEFGRGSHFSLLLPLEPPI